MKAKDKETANFVEEHLITLPYFEKKFKAFKNIIENIDMKGLCMEFGVWKGKSIKDIVSLVPKKTVYGFDSFRGLPQPWGLTDSKHYYKEGRFELNQLPKVEKNVRLISGLFQCTLEPFLETHLKKVSFAHFDADLYSSTIYVLNTLAKYGRLKRGTIIQFDEFFNYPGWTQLGEYKAFMEFITTWSVKFRYFSYGNNNDVTIEFLRDVKKLRRIDAIRNIMKTITNELIITSAGMISREVYDSKDRLENFYVQGSMGASLGIGIGLALNTDRDVLVIVGDGDILMSLGTLVLMNKLQLSNLKLIILDNNCYQTTGGQKSCSGAVDFTKICPNCKVIKVTESRSNVPRIPIPHKEITKRFYNAVNSL